MPYLGKRKYSSSTVTSQPAPSESSHPQDPNLFIQAHEADIVRGPQAKVVAASLEVRGDGVVGDGLIQLLGESKSKFVVNDEDEDVREAGSSGSEIWVDRYDARLLLDREEIEKLRQLQRHLQDTSNRPSSPGGWSDLPSDTEDTFFFSAEETEDYRREKRRRLLEKSREERLRARMEEDGESQVEGDPDPWGDSDEEPDEPQKEIMRRTAKHIATSPNPAQLEMRILANHGGDKRFAFLRGRWRRAWQVIEGKARLEHEQEQKQKQKSVLIGTLGDYGDSSGEEEERGGSELEEAVSGPNVSSDIGYLVNVAVVVDVATPSAEGQPRQPKVDNEAALKEVRRAKAKEWMAKRRAA
ncbi:hypothetical protein L218DRAFT_720913 [Marasmius fiardii PR-910]|nr:hypothetical protein L218DRAFT_720913 [Marasmius fiardii PR-910]